MTNPSFTRPTGLRRLQPRTWGTFALLLAAVVALCGGSVAVVIFGLVSADDAPDPAYERMQDSGLLLGDALDEALEREARRRAGLGGDTSGADAGTDVVADLPPGEDE